jgi:protocatechuate 3,4-dioxygenase beta subunit
MPRRLLLLFAVLLAGLLAVWLVREKRSAAPRGQSQSARADSGADTRQGELDLAASSAVRAAVEPVSPTACAAASEDVAQAAQGSAATLRVLAVDIKTRAPLAGVRITIHPNAPGHSSKFIEGSTGTLDESPITGADGRAEFELPTGIELSLNARGEDDTVGSNGESIAPLLAGEQRELTIELPSGNDLRYFGRVLSREDKRPVVGAKVTLVRGEQGWAQSTGGQSTRSATSTALAEQRTDADGRFALSLPSWRSSDIRVAAQGFALIVVQGGEDHDTLETENVVYLSRSASLTARLVDAVGISVTNGDVRLWTEAYHLGVAHHGEVYLPAVEDPEWNAATDSSGTCSFPELPPDVPLHVELTRDGEKAKRDLPPLSLSPGDAREVVWTIGSGALLEGTVVDQRGQIVRDRAIWLQRADVDTPRFFQPFHSGEEIEETKTDAEGRFAFRDVRHGRWWVGPAAERGSQRDVGEAAIAPLAEVIEIPEGATRQEISLQVSRGIYIRGRVVDPAGAAVPQTFLRATADFATWLLMARTGENGTFTLGPLAPGLYSLIASGRPHADSEKVEARAGDDDVVVQLRAGGIMSGTVVDSATGRGGAAKLTFAIQGASAGARAVDTDAEGAFRMEGLTPGIYDVAACSSGKRAGLLRGVSVLAGAETPSVVVTVVPGAVLRMKYAGADHAIGYRVLDAETVVAWDGIVSGDSKEIVVPAGRLVIESRSRSGWTDTKTVELSVGQELEIVLDGK